MFNFTLSNSVDPETTKMLQGKTSKLDNEVGNVVADSVELMKPDYTEKRKWYSAEIILKKNVAVVHIFPNRFGLRDELFMMKMRDSLKESVLSNVSNLLFLVEWIDEVDSFCVSFLKTPDSMHLSKKLIQDFYNELYKRLV